MEFSTKSASPDRQRTGCLVLGVFEGGKLPEPTHAVDAASGGHLSAVLGHGDLEPRAGATLLLHRVPKVAAERVLLVSLGKEKDFHEGPYRAALAAAVKALRATGAKDALFCLADLPLKRHDLAWKAEQVALAVSDGLYRFDRMKSKPGNRKSPLEAVAIHVAGRREAGEAEESLGRARAIAEGMALAKDLGNLPGNVCTPS